MNAPFPHPAAVIKDSLITDSVNHPEIPDSSATCAENAQVRTPWWLNAPHVDLSDVVAELARNPAPPLIPRNETTHPVGLEWGTAREARNVSR